MRVSEAMTPTVCMAYPDQTVEEAARLMCDADIGCGMGPHTRVREVMTKEVKSCLEYEDLDRGAQNMGDQQIRRLPVLNRSKQLVGVLALGDMAIMDSGGSAGDALSRISRPGGSHSQATELH